MDHMQNVNMLSALGCTLFALNLVRHHGTDQSDADVIGTYGQIINHRNYSGDRSVSRPNARSTISSCRVEFARPHSTISSTVRPQPMQILSSGRNLQVRLQGESGARLIHHYSAYLPNVRNCVHRTPHCAHREGQWRDDASPPAFDHPEAGPCPRIYSGGLFAAGPGPSSSATPVPATVPLRCG